MREAEPKINEHAAAKKAYEEEWKANKDLYRQDNLAHADGVFVHGTYYEGGVGHPREKVIYERTTKQG